MPELLAEIALPWPNKVLSPNSKTNYWGVKQSAKSEAREYAAFVAQEEFCDGKVSERLSITKELHAWIVFNPPNKIRRDLDNLLASIKPDIDGMCLGLKIDDSQIKRITLDWGKVDIQHKEGGIIIRLYGYNEASHE